MRDKNLKIAVFDFDGTLIHGDSIKIAFKYLNKSAISFLVYFYIIHFYSILIYIVTGNHQNLRKSRKKYLVQNYERLCKTELPKSSYKYLNKEVFSFLESLVRTHKIIIVSAGFKELIELFIPENIMIIATSLFDEDEIEINNQQKLTALYTALGNTVSIDYGFGNSEGDIAFLNVSKNSYWISPSGGINKYE